jgi:hypothetical protein
MVGKGVGAPCDVSYKSCWGFTAGLFENRETQNDFAAIWINSMAKHPLLVWMLAKVGWLLQYPGAEFALKSVGEISLTALAVTGFWKIFSLILMSRGSKFIVDRETCSCSCWDGILKDGERGRKVARVSCGLIHCGGSACRPRPRA